MDQSIKLTTKDQHDRFSDMEYDACIHQYFQYRVLDHDGYQSSRALSFGRFVTMTCLLSYHQLWVLWIDYGRPEKARFAKLLS